MKALSTATPQRRATDMIPNTKVRQCQQLADLACQVDALKFHFSGAALAELTLCVVQLHGIAMREAGPLVHRVYGEAEEA